MKSHFLSLLYGTALIFLFNSCGSDDDKKNVDTVGSDSTDTGTGSQTTSPGNIVNEPTNMSVVRHKVANFTQWKSNFDQHDTARLPHGIHNYAVGRGLLDTNEVLVSFSLDDVDKAKAFANTPQLKNDMKKHGVIGKPIMNYLTMVWRDTSRNTTTDIRARTTFIVKDFDTWRTTFESNRQMRMDNGLVDRAYGYDMDNRNKVTVVVAVTDTAKANAYWNSDKLKQARAASGVVGPSERFIYRVVQRY